MNNPISVRLELESMRYAIVHALSTHHEDIQAAVQKATDDAVREFDFEREIRRQVNSQLQELVSSSIRNAMSELFYRNEMAIRESIIDAFMNNVKPAAADRVEDDIR